MPYDTFLTLWAQTALLSLMSVHTSGVPISFMANLQISLSARGACFLDVFANIDGVFLDHHLVDSRTAFLLAILLCGNNSAEPKLERTACFFFFLFLFIYTILLCLRLKSSYIAQIHLKLLDLSQPPAYYHHSWLVLCLFQNSKTEADVVECAYNLRIGSLK